MPQLVPKKNAEFVVEKKRTSTSKENSLGRLFGRFESDDLLLAVIIIALLFDEGADDALIIALAFVFISGIIS